jgi:signal transduction histidine kinase
MYAGKALSYVHQVTVTARRLVLDAAIALALLAGTEVIIVAGGTPSRTPPWLRGLLVAVIVVPLAWRRRAPVVVWGVSSAATAAAIGISSPGPGVLAPLIALYTVAARSGRVASMTAGAISLAGCAALGISGSRSSVVFDDSRIRGDGMLVLAVLVAGCWLIGDNVRVRRAYVAELQAKAQRAEADQQSGQARAAARERARIARELHDVVVHHVSSIAVQAGAARMVADNGASAVEGGPTWSGIEATARQALSELRQLLGVLRNGQDPPARRPQPGLHDLEQLLEESRRAGLPVQASVDGSRVSLPASVSLAGYRVIQEALTNVRKHQGRASTSVALRYRARELEIEVSSQRAAGAPPQREGAGHGLVGMRERVTLLGGELDAGPRPDGGFLVTARIPLEGTPA